MIEREELEHELDSKNHTIRMLQKQLVTLLIATQPLVRLYLWK